MTKDQEIEMLKDKLALLEADRDEWVTAYWKSEKQRDIAQLQLAEAVVMLHRYQELVSTIDMGSATAPMDWCSHFRNEVKLRTVELGAFLARNAQTAVGDEKN